MFYVTVDAEDVNIIRFFYIFYIFAHHTLTSLHTALFV